MFLLSILIEIVLYMVGVKCAKITHVQLIDLGKSNCVLVTVVPEFLLFQAAYVLDLNVLFRTYVAE